MKRAVCCLLVIAACAALFTACRDYLPSNRFLQMRSTANMHSTADARGKFDHDRHAGIFSKANVTCVECHRFDALIAATDEHQARDLSAQALHPGSAPCHFCHTAETTRLSAAPSACITCHENLLPLRPENHDVAWIKVHANFARVDSLPCENCHRQAECINCHERRDSIQNVVHERNFRFFHGIQARANPMQCSSCHREDFCIQCHQRDGKG